MKEWLVFIVLIMLVCQTSRAQDSLKTHEYKVGETTLTIEEQCFKPCEGHITFIHLHDNESTSIEVAHDFLLQNGGRFIRLVNDSQRNVLLVVANKECCFDPNRMYSTEGIKASLLNLTDKYPSGAVEEVAKFSNQILQKFINNQSLIVSLHNNTNSNYSILQIQKDFFYKKYFGKIFINPDMDEDDFILTTDIAIYHKIVAKNINVVWENVNLTQDDGSLSHYAGKHNIPYINIEAQHEHRAEQMAMLHAIKEMIAPSGK